MVSMGGDGDREATFATKADVLKHTAKRWATGLLGPLSYSPRRGHLFVLGRGGDIRVVDIKHEKRQRGEDAALPFEIDVLESGTRLVPDANLPEGFVGTKIEACPIGSPSEQRLAIAGIVPGDVPNRVSTALFIASVNPLQSRRGGPRAKQASKVDEGKYAIRKIHDNLEGLEHLNVLKFSWHPRSANHLVALLENPLTHETFLHVYNVGDDCDHDLTTPEQKYCLRASGQGLGYGLVKVKKDQRFVDFSFGPISGWASLAIFLATQNGQAYFLWPINPFGASTDSANSRSHGEGGGDLGVDGLATSAPPPTACTLHGPLGVLGGASEDGTSSGGNGQVSPSAAVATSISCVSAGSNCIVLLTSFADGVVDAHAVMGSLGGDLSPLEHGEVGDLVSISASLNAVECADVEILRVDRIEGGEEGCVVVDALEPDNFFIFQERGIYKVHLSWLGALSQWLMGLLDEDEEGGGEVEGGLVMAPPVVSAVHEAAGDRLTGLSVFAGAMITNRIDPQICFGLGRRVIRLAPLAEDPDVDQDGAALRPSVSFDVSSLECSTAEIDAWYGGLALPPAREVGALRQSKKKADAGSEPTTNETLHENISNLKSEYIDKLHAVSRDLAERLRLVKASAEAEAKRGEEMEKSSEIFRKGMERSKTKIAEAVQRQRDLVQKAKKVGDLIAQSQVQLSASEVSFSEELRDTDAACAQLEERIKKIKARAPLVGSQRHGDQGGASLATAYIRQLPKVRSVLEETAEEVNLSVFKLLKLKTHL